MKKTNHAKECELYFYKGFNLGIAFARQHPKKDLTNTKLQALFVQKFIYTISESREDGKLKEILCKTN